MKRLALIHLLVPLVLLSTKSPLVQEELWEELNSKAAMLYRQECYAEAGKIAEEALKVAESTFGPDHVTVVKSLNSLALVYDSQSRYSEAETLYKRALTINENILGPDHLDVAESIDNLAELYRVQGNYAEAEPLYKRSLGIREKALGPDHPDVAQSLNNLALFYDSQDRYAEAEPLYTRALAINEKAFGEENINVGTYLNVLAFIYQSQERYSEAEFLIERILKIREKFWGPDDPDVAQALDRLARLYQNQGKFAEAEPLIKRAMAIDEKALGKAYWKDHYAVARDLNTLADLYRDQCKYAEAEPLYKRSLEISEKILGPHAVALTLHNLALLYQDQGKYAEAEQLYKQALGIAERTLGSEHPQVANIRENMIGFYKKIGKKEEAEKLEERARKTRSKPCTQLPAKIEKEPWFLSAKDYVEGYEIPLKYGAFYGEKDLLMMDKIFRAKKEYRNSRQPTSEEILAVLNCNDYEKTKIGLGAMRLQPLTEFEIMKKIISFWDHPSWIHRDFASAALVDIHRYELKEYKGLGDMIFAYAKQTNDDLVLSNGIRILGKFNNPKYLPFIVKYLKRHDNPLYYYSSFNALKEMDDEYFQKVREQLQREGDTETLKHFNRTDNFWREYYEFEDPTIIIK